MPNLCDFSIKVVGSKKNILEFSKIINADYNYDDKNNIYPKQHHFWRVFDCNKATRDTIDVSNDGRYEFVFTGYCAWSCYACMFDGPLSYQSENKDCKHNMGVTLPQVSEELKLDIELWSFESGCCFQEHFLISNGNMLINDCISDVYEICIPDYLDDDEEYYDKTLIDLLCIERHLEKSKVKSFLEEYSKTDGDFIMVGSDPNYLEFEI